MYQENTGKDINALTGYEVHAQVTFVFSYLNKLSDIRRALSYTGSMEINLKERYVVKRYWIKVQ